MAREESGEIHAGEDKKTDGEANKNPGGEDGGGEGRRGERGSGTSEDRGSCRVPFSVVTICNPRRTRRSRAPSLPIIRSGRRPDRLAPVFSPWGLGFLNEEGGHVGARKGSCRTTPRRRLVLVHKKENIACWRKLSIRNS
jgi:hypothetical protein